MSKNILGQLFLRYPVLKINENSIQKAGDAIIKSYENGGKLLICGNGGSASDAEHMVGELMKGFIKRRPIKGNLRESLANLKDKRAKVLMEKLQTPLPAISLVSQTALFTAFSNDVDPNLIFAQQIAGYGKKGDVLIGLSTSGNSTNVLYALTMAKALDMVTIGLTGKRGEQMKPLCDILINVPEEDTYKVQELHLPVYHALCMLIEEHFFGKTQ